MSGGYVGSTGPDDTNPVIDQLGKQAEVVRELSKPSGAQIFKTLEEVRQLVLNLADQVNNLVNTVTYNRVTIDAKDTAVLSSANAASIAYTNSQIAGVNSALGGKANVAHTHSVGDVNGGQWNGSFGPAVAISSNSTARFDGGLYSTDAYGFNITYTRVSAWVGNDGHIGFASSSREDKTFIRVAEFSPEQILSVQPKLYSYKREMEKRDGPSPIEGWQGQDYHVATEVGMIAEDLHDAGLWPWVVYGHRGDDPELVPIGIHYQLWAVALQIVARWQQERLSQLSEDMALVKAQLGL